MQDNEWLTYIDFTLNCFKANKKRPFTALPAKVNHYIPNGGGRDGYIYDNHGGLTKGNHNYWTPVNQQFKNGLRAVTAQQDVYI